MRVVDGVRFGGTGDLLEEVILLVHRLRRAEKASHGRTVFLANPLEFVDDNTPLRSSRGLAVLLDTGDGQPVSGVDDLRCCIARDADASLVDRRVTSRSEYPSTVEPRL